MSSSKFSRNIKGRISTMANWSGGPTEEENEEPQAFGEKLRQEMEVATVKLPIEEVELNQLLNNPYQYLARRNMDDDTMGELVDSIKNNGFYGALLARRKVGQPGKLEVAYGHRRKEAARRAGLKTLPVKVVELSDTEMARIMASENFSRLDLDPIGEAGVVGFLADQQNLSAREIAQFVGKKRGWVESRLALYNAPQSVKQLVEEKPATFSHVPQLLRLRKDEHLLKEMAEQVSAEQLTLEELRERVDKILNTHAASLQPDPLRGSETPDSPTQEIVKNTTVSMLHGDSDEFHDISEGVIGNNGEKRNGKKGVREGTQQKQVGLIGREQENPVKPLEQQLNELEQIVNQLGVYHPEELSWQIRSRLARASQKLKDLVGGD